MNAGSILPTDATDVAVAEDADAYRAARSVLAAFSLDAYRGKRVLLKPNAGRCSPPGTGVNTNPQVVAAAIDSFTEAGATVAVGESPITGVNTLEALETSGIAAVAREHECPLIDMDARHYVEVEIPNGEAITHLKVCPEALEFDSVVSIPVMKTHMHTGVTLAIKNMKGCLWRRSKVDLHMLPAQDRKDARSLEIAIADMASVLRPDFALIDGTIGMEGLGPSAGTPKPLGVVVAGPDGFATDAVACHLMGRNAEEVPYLRLGAERGYGIIDLDRIKVFPEHWKSFASPFEAAPENLAIEFPDVTIHDDQSCSACQSTLLLFLRKHGAELREYFPENDPINIAIGKGHTEVPEGTLCIGNCTARHRKQGKLVAGCPPVGSAILKNLQARD
ncbi:MAG: DUF362 domain-containing protein [Verrucomicrobia bacterium]|nr:DUF362 domain-containing protein [Verrucomicrobiota bacterium]